MESLESISNRISNFVEEDKKSLLPSLAPRMMPMSSEDIEKMHKSIEKYFAFTTTQNYGYVPVIENGEAIKQEYDVVSETNHFRIRDDVSVPQAMWEAMMRPATRPHVIYHLGRLAAHRHYAKGQTMLMALIEDLSFDLSDVSEWAVIMACGEMRRKRDTWYPSAQEILETIMRHDATIKGSFSKRLEAPRPKKSRHDPSNYYKDPRDNPARRDLCDFIIAKGGEDYFDQTFTYSNYQLEQLAGAKYGWRKEKFE